MKIYLYLSNQVKIFYLPEIVSGSYSFDMDENEVDKLINVNSKDGKWILSSTDVCKVLSGSQYVAEDELLPYKFYVITREKVNFLIYVTDYDEKNFKSYAYGNEFEISVGVDNATSVYSCPYIKQLSFKILYKDNKLVLQKSNAGTYLNKKNPVGNEILLKIGDEISLYGARILILNKIVIVYSDDNVFSINASSAHLSPYNLIVKNDYNDYEVKDRDLFTDDDYYFKSPRLRRVIKEKEIELSDPPSVSQSEDLPFILTAGPMVTMAGASAFTMITPIVSVISGQAKLSSVIGQIIPGALMLVSSLLWPAVISIYNKRNKAKKDKITTEKYNKYLKDKEDELIEETKLQNDIIIENVISLDACLENLKRRKIGFWDKRIDQSDFLVARVGVGDELLKVKVKDPKDGFSADEDELKKKVKELVEKYKYIKDVPIGYSFYENNITAVMGTPEKSHNFINNVLFQFLTFYGYDDLKVVVFTSEQDEKYWDYLKYLNHNMVNDNSFRFFATDEDNASKIIDYLSQLVEFRKSQSDKPDSPPKPYFLIIVDNLDIIKKNNIVEKISEIKDNVGFSSIILERKLSKLPSLCNNFINLDDGLSGILKNSYEDQEQQMFKDEINPNINMMEVAKILANIPIEITSDDEDAGELPEAITFLELLKVGKVEQLNIMNRWNTNDSTTNLKAEVGVDPGGKYLYLDLHEKAHGPHGLIAGMTGSGKSEFIITWILSVCMNFSPDDVAFILIDYKGGGLAYAFENQVTGVRLPHLAGTITNLDKSEINRTLVSIDSEVKRRQSIFNEARDKLGESTIDIYKYQGFYHDGKLDEPLPHLFIVCDEFAELKSQQPDFMQNLISVARIGRSLGVHLILATQKPSGVVDEQIWSNSKFRVCLKVQDASDSNEMLKREDAASLKQTGRFYLQVGYDEYFALGQSGWCGAKYYPSDVIQKSVDKSINILDDVGIAIKSIQSGSKTAQGEAQGEQLAAVLNEIINVSKQSNKVVRRLWLDNIPEVITIDNTIKKYNIDSSKKDFSLLIGEYDAPELQQQHPLLYNLLSDGNLSIVSTDSQETEEFISTLLYGIVSNYIPSEISYYLIDYGSQNFQRHSKSLHCGGIVTPGDTESYNNLLKIITNEQKERKRILSEYGGDYLDYVKENPGKMPIMLIVINNWESIMEAMFDIIETLPGMSRDSERFGIVFLISSSALLSSKVEQTMNSHFAFKLKEIADYGSCFGVRERKEPKSNFGRGICINEETLHEFQLAFIAEDKVERNNILLQAFEKVKNSNVEPALKIPALPDQVMLDDVKGKIKGAKRLPVGIERGTLKIRSLDLTVETGKLVICSKIKYAATFMKNIVKEIQYAKENLVILDPTQVLGDLKGSVTNYYDSDFDNVLEKIKKFIQNQKSKDVNNIIVILSVNKLISSLNDESMAFSDFVDECAKSGNSYILGVDESSKIKNYMFDNWYGKFDVSEGVFVGNGVSDQSILRISTITREMSDPMPPNYGYYICEGMHYVVKLIEFEKIEVDQDDEE